MRLTTPASMAIALLAVGLSPALAGSDELKVGLAATPNLKPEFLGPVNGSYYDGVGDDLLTAGLGKTGLAGAAPGFANALAPTAAELRRRAIHTNYRAVLDITATGGYGRFYGPNIDSSGNDTLGEGKVPGWEYLAYADDGSGRKNVTLMVQIPDSFNPAKACIVTATSSGSRGVYGAIGASGEWGLKRGCAVAYTDKGSGNGLHDLMTNTIGLIDGTRVDAASAGAASHFTAAIDTADRAVFNAATPNRVAFKHAHSRQNPEQDWGRNTLQAVVFAFYALNDKFGTAGPGGLKRIVFDRKNTLVIASGISNGAGAALAAAEQDRHGLIDGVAVTEPNVQTDIDRRLRIIQGSTPMPTIGRPLYDYFSYANLYQPCAALAVGAAAPSFAFLGLPNPAGAANRCAGLAAKGLVAGGTLTEWAADALQKLRNYGWLADSDALHASHYRFATNAIAVTYSNAYGRFGVADNLCGYSLANTAGNTFVANSDGSVAAQNPALQASIFATGNGVPPTTGVNVVYNDSVGGALLDLQGVSPSTGLADLSLDGAICQRNLAVGHDIVSGAELSGAMKAASERVRRGIGQVLVEARLKNLPAIIVHGRSDALIPVNHASRAYYAANQREARGVSKLRYVEITNGQHFDAFLPGGAFAGYEKRFIPLHVYLIEALDRMYAHLTEGAALPPSQVVRTTPRCSDPSCAVAPPLEAANLPAIADVPAEGDLIRFDHGTLRVPD